MSPAQPLPPKENALFKKIIKCYDTKAYKNGLKFAKQILSNPDFSGHGETLAMKGLILNCLGKKEEAYEYVKRGLRNDLKSHVCWHVYGLLQRSDHKYDEAIKCYRNALKWDKDNIQILRDLSMLQIHMRDLEGYRDTRYQLFMLRPAPKVSWIGYAMAYHLLKDYDMAISILDALHKTSVDTPSTSNAVDNANSSRTSQGKGKGSRATGQTADGSKSSARSGSNDAKVPRIAPNQENSELLLYHATILTEAGKYSEALDFLKKSKGKISDTLAVHEMKTQLLLSLGRNSEAIKLIKDHLIARNCENYQYYKWLEEAQGMNTPTAIATGKTLETAKVKMYLEFQQMYPKAQLPFRIPLNFLQDEQVFRSSVDSYIRRSLARGQPALFRDLKSIYASELGSSASCKAKKELEKLNWGSVFTAVKSTLSTTNATTTSNATTTTDTATATTTAISTTNTNTNTSVTIATSVTSATPAIATTTPGENESIGKANSTPRAHLSPLPQSVISTENCFKVRTIEKLMVDFYNNLKINSSMESDENSKGSADPTRILWVIYYLAQHYDYLGNYRKALSLLDEAFEHTPTLIEFYVLQGRILKHLGDIDGAISALDQAQSLDTADRYLNSKAAKYLLRGNKIKEAEDMCAYFTREGVSAAESLNEMQCMWFQTEAAAAYQRLGQFGESLKKCIEVDRHFAEITEDQFDFHVYCMRKMTLRAYVGLLRLEDILKSHPFYFKAAKIAIENYLRLHDQPLSSKEKDSLIGNLTPAELKKLKRKEQRKELQQQQQQQLQNNSSSNSASNNSHEKKNEGENSSSDSVFEPLYPSKLERPEDPLSEALKFLRPLQLLARERIDTHLLAFEIHFRRKKILLMLQSLKRAIRIDSNHVVFKRQLASFLKMVQDTRSQLSEPLVQVLDSELTLFQLQDLTINTTGKV